MHQFSLQVGSVSQVSFVVVKCVVQVGDRTVCTQTVDTDQSTQPKTYKFKSQETALLPFITFHVFIIFLSACLST